MPKKRPPIPRRGSLKLRKTLSMPGLLKRVRDQFERIEDRRKKGVQYALPDVLMSGLALFTLKDESLLRFDGLRDMRRDNLRSLFGIEQAPCDTQMRQVLDGVDPDSLRPAFREIHREVQRQGVLESDRFLGKYLVSIDGTGQFSSSQVSCPECCQRRHRGGRVSYYHQLLGAVIVHPDQPTVVPFCPEAITRKDGANKNDCEHNASKRLLSALAKDFPRLEMIILQDALACNGPHIQALQAHGFSFIISAKPKADSLLLKQLLAGLETGDTQEIETINAKGRQCGYRYANGLSLNSTHPHIQVNFIDYWEERPDGSQFLYACVTDLPLTADNVADVVRAGRSRWKVENETCNTLKNQGYHLEHNYGHGKRHLSTVFAYLMMLAFLLDQVQEACCRYFQAARDRCHSRKALWDKMRSWFHTTVLPDWETFFSALIWEPVKQAPVWNDSG